jgi:TolB-like protein/class 3 adenylate cyclase
MSSSERRLAAIMLTDIVGYTALGQENESAALELLARHRELIRPLFSRHAGREVKTMGDAFLVEFASALEATLCAIDIQSTVHSRNLERGEKLQVRIGIHVGDVMHQEGDVLGDTVNVASRIEPLAQAGGVCISGQVFDHVKNKVSYPFVRLEAGRLKNVNDSVEVYRIVLPWEGQVSKVIELDTRRIAILPFSNMSPDPNDEYFADGITEEVISTASAITGLTLIARASVMRYKGMTKGIEEIGKELQVGTVLEGSVRKAGSRLRIGVQLIDVQSQGHLWAETYDRDFGDVFAVQSDIAKQVANAL